MTDGRLAGRTILVTGASSGLGERFARVAVREGANVIAGARRVDRLLGLAQELSAAGGACLAVPLDVADEGSIKAAFDAGEQAYGPITGIVANAGVNAEGAAIDLPIEAFDALFAVNVRGVFLTAREAARRLQRHGRAADGRIVLVSSITARMTTPGLAAYSASKAAVTHMGKMLAREWARTGPNVTILSPGYIRTELAGDWFDTEGGARQMAKWPRRRLLDEDALDEALLWLLSDASRNVTGSEIVVDDGQSL